MSGQLHAPAALSPGKESLYPLNRRLGGPQSRSESIKKIPAPTDYQQRKKPNLT